LEYRYLYGILHEIYGPNVAHHQFVGFLWSIELLLVRQRYRVAVLEKGLVAVIDDVFSLHTYYFLSNFCPQRYTNFLRGRALIHILLMFQPCHPCAGLSDGGDLWLRRVSQVCRRGSAGLHRLLNILRPYGAGSRRNGTKAVAETPCGASATDDSGLCAVGWSVLFRHNLFVTIIDDGSDERHKANDSYDDEKRCQCHN